MFASISIGLVWQVRGCVRYIRKLTFGETHFTFPTVTKRNLSALDVCLAEKSGTPTVTEVLCVAMADEPQRSMMPINPAEKP